jgi:hypothetical protein
MSLNWCVISLYTCAVSIFGLFICLCHLNSYITHLVCKEHDGLKNAYDYIVGKLYEDESYFHYSIDKEWKQFVL